jgi:hypothetical protein
MGVSGGGGISKMFYFNFLFIIKYDLDSTYISF